jgi:hypothetical protein
MAASKPPLFSP